MSKTALTALYWWVCYA